MQWESFESSDMRNVIHEFSWKISVVLLVHVHRKPNRVVYENKQFSHRKLQSSSVIFDHFRKYHTNEWKLEFWRFPKPPKIDREMLTNIENSTNKKWKLSKLFQKILRPPAAKLSIHRLEFILVPISSYNDRRRVCQFAKFKLYSNKLCSNYKTVQYVSLLWQRGGKFTYGIFSIFENFVMCEISLWLYTKTINNSFTSITYS